MYIKYHIAERSQGISRGSDGETCLLQNMANGKQRHFSFVKILKWLDYKKFMYENKTSIY